MRLIPVLFSLKETQARANKTGINFMIFILSFVENCPEYVTNHDFLVCPRTGSKTADID